MHQHRTIEDTVYFWFAANNTSGSGDDGATPASHVRLAGASADAAPVTSPTPILLTSVSFPAGLHEIAVSATVANGFAAGNTYAVFSTLLVDLQNPSGFLGSFSLEPIIADIREIGGIAQSATDLKDFVDSGYDPVTNKVQGVVLVDTTTVNTDMRGTDSAALASVCTESRLSELDAANLPADLDTLIAGVNVSTVDGSTEAASNLKDSAETMKAGAVIAGTLTTTVFTTNLTVTIDSYYNNRLLNFKAGSSLEDQGVEILAYDGTTKELTVSQLTGAPIVGDDFIII